MKFWVNDEFDISKSAEGTICDIFSDHRFFNHFQRHLNYRSLLQRSQPNLFHIPQIAFGADTGRAYSTFQKIKYYGTTYWNSILGKSKLLKAIPVIAQNKILGQP